MNLKDPARIVASNAIALVVTSLLLRGFDVSLTLYTIAVSAVVLSLVNAFLNPILKTISLPINILTLGLFGLIINALLLYLTIVFVPGITVHADRIYVDFMGLVIPEIKLSWFWTLVLASAVIRLINLLLKWILF